MTKEQAIQAMRDGQKVTHRYFTPDEWMMIDKKAPIVKYIFEDGNTISSTMFWSDHSNPCFDIDWSVFKERGE